MHFIHPKEHRRNQGQEAHVHNEPAHDDVAATAYAFWVARGYEDGHALEDWLRAEEVMRLFVAGPTRPSHASE